MAFFESAILTNLDFLIILDMATLKRELSAALLVVPILSKQIINYHAAQDA
jgi:hypothetical protein